MTGLQSAEKHLQDDSIILSKRFEMKDGYACPGDSGGPLVVEKEGSYVVVGVVSTVPSLSLLLSWPPPCYCNCEGTPEWHARVSIAVPWIRQVMHEKKLTFSCVKK